MDITPYGDFFFVFTSFNLNFSKKRFFKLISFDISAIKKLSPLKKNRMDSFHSFLLNSGI